MHLKIYTPITPDRIATTAAVAFPLIAPVISRSIPFISLNSIDRVVGLGRPPHRNQHVVSPNDALCTRVTSHCRYTIESFDGISAMRSSNHRLAIALRKRTFEFDLFDEKRDWNNTPVRSHFRVTDHISHVPRCSICSLDLVWRARVATIWLISFNDSLFTFK